MKNPLKNRKYAIINPYQNTSDAMLNFIELREVDVFTAYIELVQIILKTLDTKNIMIINTTI